MKKSILFFLFIFTCFSIKLNASEFKNKDSGYLLDLPEDWTMAGQYKPEFVSFTDPSQTAVMQVFVYKGGTFASSYEIYNFFKTHLNASGIMDNFLFNGRDSVFSDLSFSSDNVNVRGYCVFIKDDKYDYALLSYSETVKYEANHDLLLSCIDSFSLSDGQKNFPGPVSQYYYPFPGRYLDKVNISIKNSQIMSFIDLTETEISQILIEREARVIMKSAQNKQIEAWKRFYRMIYRDNYQRLNVISEDIQKILNISPSSTDGILHIIKWIQKFKFMRSGTFADFDSPVTLLSKSSGDCDSRVLLLLIILHHMNVDSIILVSDKYSHSMIGINMNKQGGGGIKYKFNNKEYLMVELTAEVEPGLVNKQMADLNNWIPVSLGK